MEKRKWKIFYRLFFVLAIFFTAFILIEFHDDYLAVAGAGAVLLISAYLLFDKLENDINGEESSNEDIKDKSKDIEILEHDLKNIASLLTKIEKIDKAVYVAMKKPESKEEDYLRHIIEIKEMLRSANSDKLATMIKTVDNDIKAGCKAVIKFNKENAETVRESIEKNSEVITESISEKIGAVADCIREHYSSITDKLDSGKEQICNAVENITFPEIDIDKSVLEEHYNDLSVVMAQNLVTISESIDETNNSLKMVQKIIKENVHMDIEESETEEENVSEPELDKLFVDESLMPESEEEETSDELLLDDSLMPESEEEETSGELVSDETLMPESEEEEISDDFILDVLNSIEESQSYEKSESIPEKRLKEESEPETENVSEPELDELFLDESLMPESEEEKISDDFILDILNNIEESQSYEKSESIPEKRLKEESEPETENVSEPESDELFLDESLLPESEAEEDSENLIADINEAEEEDMFESMLAELTGTTETNITEGKEV